VADETKDSARTCRLSTMAPTKKGKKSSNDGGKQRSSMSGTGLKRVKGENFYRDAKKASKVKMLTGGKPVYDRDGKMIEAAAFQKGEEHAKPGRVQPDRRWFGGYFVFAFCKKSIEAYG
jgi:nuclear GTP-binding protein